MLTSWKTIHTTLEYNTPISPGSSSSKKKKKSLSSVADDIESSASSFGAQFVVIEDDKSPSNSSKKRRKVEESQPINFGISRKDKYTFDTSPSITHIEDEKKVMLCVTTTHRAVFLDNEGDMAIGSSSSSRTSSLIENKSRSYVTKPGIDSSFSLTNNTTSSSNEGTSSSEGGSETFSGILPTGVQYHPSTNLLYGVRNSGCEIAIWSALPSSKLAGPDDTTGIASGMMNGGEMNGSATPNSKKRKPPHNQHQQQKQSIENEIISERIHLPKGKVATSLTPFSIPVPNSSSSKKNKKAKGGGGGGGGSNNNSTKTLAIGATGCCDDGSIWIVSRFANQIDDKFQLRIVDGTSIKKKNEKVLDSCISGAFGNISHDHAKSDSITLFIQSVILSNGKDRSNVSVRTHKVRVYGSVAAVKGGKKGGGRGDKHSSTIHLEKYTSQDVIELETSNVAVKLESSQGPPLSQLSIVHKKQNVQEESSDGWMFTSVDFFNSKLKSKMSFPLPYNNDDMIIQHETVFSFGKLGPNIIALLMKGQGKESSVMSLRVLDYQRKAELSKISWVEGGVDDDDKQSTMNILNGKVCHSMVTNELDGSVALLTTSSSSLDVLYSKLDLSSTRITARADQAPLKVTSNSASLAATLRLVATSTPLKADTNDLIITKGSLDLASMITNDATANIAHQRQVDNAVNEACKLLVTSSKELIDATMNSNNEKHISVTNGKSKKGSKSSKKNSRADLIRWKEVYQNSCNLIATATEGGKLEKGLVNGIIDRGDGVGTSDMPKGFLEIAFKESTTILLTLYKADDSIKGQKTFQTTVQEATYVILEILKTKVILSRANYGVGQLLYRGNILLSVLKACPPTFGNEEDIGKFHIINAMLDNVDDIHEVALVSILRHMLRNVNVEDVVSFYASNSSDAATNRGARLSQQYKAISDAEEDSRKKIETKLLSEALLSVASKIVKYSKCNHTFLTKAMKDSIKTKEEVETVLLTFSKLLKLGSTTRDTDTTKSETQVITLSMGTIYWISALTDAHVEKISTITNEGGVAMEKFHRSLRSAVAQSEFASEIKDTIDSFLSPRATTRVAKAKSIIATSRTGDTDTVPSYSMEYLNF